MRAREVIVLERQNIMDISLQETGSIEAAIDIILDDPSVLTPSDVDPELQDGLMSELKPGQKVMIKQPAWDAEILAHYQGSGIRPVTDFKYIPPPPEDARDFHTPDFNESDFA